MGIQNPRKNFRPFEYQKAFEFCKAQNDHHWTHGQIEVDSDLMQYNTEFTEAEKHGINTVLKLFTTYEVHVADYWSDVVYQQFPKPEIRMMAQVFSAMEAEHALFYDKLNDALGLSTKDFYLSFLEEPEMKERMEFIGEMVNLGRGKDPTEIATSLAAFSFVEGVVLYSSFAFLMSFQRPPKNKLKNIFTGLSYSTRDESIHADADSWLFNTFVNENKDQIDFTELNKNVNSIVEACEAAETKIIDNIFSKGKIEGITDHQLKNFVKSRIDKKLRDIKYEPVFKVEYNPISSWFYRSINSVEMTDFFAANPTAYNSDWNFSKIKEW